MDEIRFDIDFKGNNVLNDTQIHGNIHAKQSIVLHGVIQGNIKCEQDIVVNQGATIQGDVTCNRLFLNGIITGNAHVTHQTTLGAQARIEGSLVTASLVITSGASIQKGLKLQKPIFSKSKPS